jgi:hypothetical protein
MLHDPDKRVMEKAYARWAPVYDALCGPIFLNGRRAAAQSARDLRLACLCALDCSRQECRDHAQRMTWESSARLFIHHVTDAAKAARKLAA